MATPRRGWFQVANDIIDHYPDAKSRGVAIGLMAIYARRWANGASSADLSGEIRLTNGELSDATGYEVKRYSVAALELVRGCSVRRDGVEVYCHWPKFSEFQRLETRESGKVEPLSKAKQSRGNKNPPPEGRKPSPTENYAWMIPILPGGTDDEREAFLHDEWSVIVAEAEADAESKGTKISTQIKRIGVRYWKHRQKNPDGKKGPRSFAHTTEDATLSLMEKLGDRRPTTASGDLKALPRTTR